VKKFIITFFVFSFWAANLSAQTAMDLRKSTEAVRVTEAPKLDGVLDDVCWQNVPIATGFIIDNPHPGIPLEQNTEVRAVYTDEAIYFSFMNYDTAPDSILTQLTGRDADGNSDYCGITFNCYRDGINAFTFAVSPLGEQFDARSSGSDGEDTSWNAVWYCKTEINSQGWTAEFKIPFAAIRFPDAAEQTWGINYIREVRRTRHHSFWSPVDPAGPGYVAQMGLISGIKGIKPPRRIFLYPYASAYYNLNEQADGSVASGYSYNGGLDLKLGLSDAFTLDATLIPDFGQTLSDQLILNLSAFDIQFTDNRPFFMEGLELFSKAGIFYSRRIGFDEPINRYKVGVDLKESEIIKENPDKDQVINAIKISGRDNQGLGFGFFNAVTSASHATIEDVETGNTRQVETSPLTNYNVIVFDQNLKNNSFLSLINTSVLRAGNTYDANVTGYQYEVRNKKNSHSISGRGSVNTKFGGDFARKKDDGSFGHSQSVSVNKITGNLLWNAGTAYESDLYDPNDLGFIQAPNSVNYFAGGGYNIYKPFGRFNRLWSWASAYYNTLYKPYAFTDVYLSGELGMNSKKFNAFQIDYEGSPVRGYDYFEPRVAGRYFRTYTNHMIGGWYSTDYRKAVAWDLGTWFTNYENEGRYQFNWRVAPRFRFNDHLFVTYVYSFQSHKNDIGFGGWTDDSQTQPVFGQRDVISHTNVLNVQYAFGPWMMLNTRLRHYWGYSRYHEYYELKEDGYLCLTDAVVDNRSFNSFTVDMVYRWIFSMGSELNVVWKSSIIDFADEIPSSLTKDFDYTFGRPQNNSFSVRAIFFVDYRAVSAAARSRKKQSSSL
jgi:hypothetical protein